MSEVKIATRESYGKALTELGKVNPDDIVREYGADTQAPQRQVFLKKNFRTDILTAV